MTTVLVTGIDGALAALVGGVLARQEGVRVLGVGRSLPDAPPPGVEPRSCPLRGPSLQALMAAEGVDTVVHLAQEGEERPAAFDSEAFGNALLTMELLAAAAAVGVRRTVLRSSTLIYGAAPDLPAIHAESDPPRLTAASGLYREYVEIEHFVANLLDRSEMAIVTLRCAPLAGGGVSSPLSRYLRLPAPPVVFGYDPRLQVLHPDDAALAFTLAALAETPSGPLNIAAAPIVTLFQAIQLAGRVPLPAFAPLLHAARRVERGLRAPDMLPLDPAFLRFSWVADVRAAREILGFEPQHTSYEALRELAATT